ncbi:MAG: hypothetical protein ACPGJH_04015 [Alphaproteobacteria bacterium]
MDQSISKTRLGWRQYLLGLFFCLLSISVLSARLGGDEIYSYIAYTAALGIFIMALSGLGLREFYLIFVCFVLGGAALLTLDNGTNVLLAGLDQGVFLMNFLLLLTLLHQAASTSTAVARVGSFLTQQPASRRYLAISGGSSIMGVIFNLGTITMLTPLIHEGVANSKGDDELKSLRERRQLNAMLRGFAWCVIWSPTALAPVAVMELIDGIDRNLWSFYGFLMSVLILALGWVEDHYMFRKFAGLAQRQGEKSLPPPGMSLLHFGQALAILFGLSYMFSWLANDSVVVGILFACPLMMLGWILLQAKEHHLPIYQATAVRLHDVIFGKLTLNLGILVTLGCSGFIGRAAAALVPAEEVASTLGLYGMPDFLFLFLVPLAMMPFALLGLSPIVMAVFFGGLFGSLEVLPADPTLLALAISMGWALSMTMSPFATVVLLMSRLNGISGLDLTLRWNWCFNIITIFVMFLMLMALTGGT